MATIRKVVGGFKFLFDKNYRFIYQIGLGKYNSMPDKEFLERYYYAIFRKDLNLTNPKSFSEKLQWIKLYDHNPLYTLLVDKYLVRRYVEETIGSKYLIPLLGVWEDPEDIDFNALPTQFVLKCNHNSGTGMCICKDKTKLNYDTVKADLLKGLNEDYYLYGREWPYKDVPRRIICEKYLTYNDHVNDTEKNDCNDEYDIDLKDYKIFCFNGKARFLKVDFDRFVDHHANYYDLSGNLLPFGEAAYPPKADKDIQLPHNLYEMVELAELLSRNIPFVRVDLYNVHGKIYFGELTLFPISGLGKYIPEEWDDYLGEYLVLPK